MHARISGSGSRRPAVVVALQRGLTLREFLALPEEEPPLEYVDGVITQKVSPKGPHTLRTAMFTTRVNVYAVPRKLALAFPEQRTTFGGRSYVPDVSVYRWERIPWTGPADVEDDFPLPPDVAVEIISPGQSWRKLSGQCQWFVENGVGMALLIDPRRRRVRLFLPGQAARELALTDRIDLGDVIPGFPLVVGDLYTLLDPA